MCFAFDPAPGYPAWRVEKNRRLLVAYVEAVREVCTRFRLENRHVTAAAVLRAVGVPQSLAYLTPRAGLMSVLEAGRESALVLGAGTRPKGANA